MYIVLIFKDEEGNDLKEVVLPVGFIKDEMYTIITAVKYVKDVKLIPKGTDHIIIDIDKKYIYVYDKEGLEKIYQ